MYKVLKVFFFLNDAKNKTIFFFNIYIYIYIFNIFFIFVSQPDLQQTMHESILS